MVVVNPAMWMEERIKDWAGNVLDEQRRKENVQNIQATAIKTKMMTYRTWKFWTRTMGVYAGYKVSCCHFPGVS